MDIMKKRMLLITVLFGIMLTVCSCSGYLNADDNAGVAKNGPTDNAGGYDPGDILDGVTPGETATIESAREDIRNGDRMAALVKLEQGTGEVGVDDRMFVNYLIGFEYGEDVRMSGVFDLMEKNAYDEFIIETLNAEPAVQEYLKLCGEYTCGDITLIISDDGSALRQGTDEDGTEYEEPRSVYYCKGKYWLENFNEDSEPAPKEYIERSGENLIITVDDNEYTYEKKSN